MQRLLTALIASLYLGNAAWMLIDPGGWYETVPGVVATGPANSHFVRDLGFAYLLSGAACAAGLWQPARLGAWLAGGSAWPGLHAVFHVAEWTHHGLPAVHVLASDLAGVVAPVLLAGAIILTRARPPLSDLDARS